MRFILFFAAPLLMLAVGKEPLRPDTVEAFRDYVKEREGAIQSERLQGQRFLWAQESKERLDAVRSGDVVIGAVAGKGVTEVKGGLVHNWVGSVFLPGATLAKVLATLQNYDNHKNLFAPEVIDSKLRSRQGGRYKVYFRLVKKKVITVVLNTEHDVEYFRLGDRRVHSRSYSTRIAEVDSPGTHGEHELPDSSNHGFLWRINSYWRFEERDGGVFVECEAISLTRGIPFGLGGMLGPIVRDLPRESLTKTLEATRSALNR